MFIVNMKGFNNYIFSVFTWLMLGLMVPMSAMAGDLISISGKVVNAKNKKALPNVTLSVPGTNIATVSNSEGKFTLKIPEESVGNGIRAYQLGFRSMTVDGQGLKGEKEIVIRMVPIGKVLDEVIVTDSDPKEIVREALRKIPENYSNSNNLFSGFYRETVQKGSRFVSISEAILDVLKRPYKSRVTNGEKVQINKGRRLLSQKASDTLAVKLVGGPYMAVLLDAVKNGEHIFGIDELDDFDFKMEAPASIDDRMHYTIGFKPIYRREYPLHKGKLFIDKESMAISRVEFELDMSDKDKVTDYILKKKPSGLYFRPQEVSGVVTYKLVDGRSYINYLSSVMKFKCDWKKKLFSSNYTSHAEMVMVDRIDNPEKDLKFNNTFNQRKVFTDVVDNYWEEDFWKDYNIIEPTESLEKAVGKLKKGK